MENVVIKVGGMSCQGCVKNITGVLTALPGVTAAEVSLEAAEARVAFDPQVVSRSALVGGDPGCGLRCRVS
jgi:copper chaperone